MLCWTSSIDMLLKKVLADSYLSRQLDMAREMAFQPRLALRCDLEKRVQCYKMMVFDQG